MPQSFTSPVTLSVVAPMDNGREAVDHFVARLRSLLDGLGETYEVVAVNDGSDNLTVARLQQLRVDWPQLRLVSLGRNVGHQAALRTGLRSARGECVVSIDVDHRAMRRLVGPWVSDNAGDFRLMSRTVVDVLYELPEQRQVHRQVAPPLGFPGAGIPDMRAERVAGETDHPLSRMIKLTLNQRDQLLRRSAEDRHVARRIRNRPRSRIAMDTGTAPAGDDGAGNGVEFVSATVR